MNRNYCRNLNRMNVIEHHGMSFKIHKNLKTKLKNYDIDAMERGNWDDLMVIIRGQQTYHHINNVPAIWKLAANRRAQHPY